jgi:uncharacterized repeat protein (TIGR03803 family)
MKSNENWREDMKSLTANRLFAWQLPFLRWAVCFFVLALAAMPLHAQFTFNDHYDFSCATGCEPYNYGTLAFGRDYRLYGTTLQGGANNQGVLFAATASGVYTPLFSFGGGGTNGFNPIGGLTVVNDPVSMHDLFYGTTMNGGKHGFGAVFRYDATTSTFTVLHNFNGTDGKSSQTPPTVGSDGNLYGVTGTGTTYRIKRPADTFKLLPGNAGGGTTAPLIQGSDNNLWGTTNGGGTSGYGSVFYMTGATITTVYSFTGGLDGSIPSGPLTEDASGTLYGTAEYSGANGNGVIFTIGIKKPYSFNTLYAFDAGFDNTDGSRPIAGLTPAGGKLYLGAGSSGGVYGYGTLFDVTSGGAFTPLFELNEQPAPPSAVPTTTLRQFMDGNFYGLMSGGPGGAGTFYSLNPPDSIVNITWCCNNNLVLDQPVTVLGFGFEGAVSVTFGGVAAQFQPGSNTYLTATVPDDAVDGSLAVVLATGEEVQSLQIAHILPKIINLDPSSGEVGSTVDIAGGGFAGTTKVWFGGVKATTFTVLSPSLIQAIVPAGAETGKVDVKTPNGTAVSPEVFTVN